MLQSLKNRLPPRQVIKNIFTISVIVIQAWAFFNLFREVPAIRLRLEFWDVLGTVAYIQAFALLESLLITGVFILIGMALPKGLRESRFSAMAITAVLVAAVWSIFIHYDLVPLKEWPAAKLYGRLALLLGSLILALVPVYFFEPLSNFINKVAKEGFILAQLYSLIGILGFIIIIIRNVA